MSSLFIKICGYLVIYPYTYDIVTISEKLTNVRA